MPFIEILVPILVALISGILGPLLLFYVKARREEERPGNPPNTVIMMPPDPNQKIVDKVDRFLERMIRNTSADRLYVMYFIPPVYNRSDAMQRISVLSESTSPGIRNDKQDVQNLVATFFSDIIAEVVREKVVYYDEDYLPDHINNLFRRKGCCEMILAGLFDLEDNLVGIFGIDYVRDPCNVNGEKKLILGEAYKLAGFLSNMKEDIHEKAIK